MTNRILSFLFSVSTKDHGDICLGFFKTIFELNFPGPISQTIFQHKIPTPIFNANFVSYFCVEEVAHA